MRRGEIRVVNLGNVVGGEAARIRPAVIVGNDGANTTAARLGSGVVTVVPVTSNTKRVYSFQVLLGGAETGLERDCRAQAEQVRSVAVERVGNLIGQMPPDLMGRLDDALRLHLAV